MLMAYFDGASRGNPGPSAVGAVILDGGNVVWEIANKIGVKTCNEAEYTALIELLKELRRRNVDRCLIRGDSQLVVNQVAGDWIVRAEGLQSLWFKANSLMRDGYKLNWVPREQNIADALTRKAFLQAPELKSKITANMLDATREVAPGIYIVPSGSNPTASYAVDTKIGACTCPIYMAGKMRPCKHILAVETVRQRSAAKGV